MSSLDNPENPQSSAIPGNTTYLFHRWGEAFGIGYDVAVRITTIDDTMAPQPLRAEPGATDGE